MPISKRPDGFKLSELLPADSQVLGNRDVRIKNIASLETASLGSICFSNDKRSASLSKSLESPLSALIIKPDSEHTNLTIPEGKALILYPEPQRLVISIIDKLYDRTPSFSGISDKAAIDGSATIGNNCTIAPFVAIAARVQIGDNTTIHPNVTIYRDVKIGKGCIIHAGAVVREECELADGVVIQPGAIIGGDGFGYMPDKVRGLIPVPQLGNVQLSSDVEIGSNACIDRATLGTTTVGHGSKIDNLVQIGHNVRIGKFSIICGQTGIAGSTKIGNQVVLAGQVGVADHLNVTDGVRCAAGCTVTSDLNEKGDYAGFPAAPAIAWRRQMVALRRLPDLQKELKQAENETKTA